MKSNFVLANDIIIEFKGRHLSQFPGETQLGTPVKGFNPGPHQGPYIL